MHIGNYIQIDSNKSIYLPFQISDVVQYWYPISERITDEDQHKEYLN